MTSKLSQKSPIQLLRADGTLEALHLTPGPFQPGFVVLARERCLFEKMETAPGLNARAAQAAARLQADTGAPYQRSSAVITQKGASFGVWWWDAQWVGEKLGGAGIDPSVRIVPEPLVRAAGEGWRIVRASSGYEAQLWKQGFLHADLWRRTAFDAAAWQDFVRVQPDQTGAEAAVLVAQEAPWTMTSPYRRMVMTDWTPQRMTRTAIAAGIALVIAAGLYFVGEGIGLKRNTADLVAQAEELKATTPATANVPAQVSSMIALKSAIEGPNPMVMLQAAQQAIEPFGHKILAFDATREDLTIVLPKEAVEDLEGLSRDLAASPYFSGVVPSLGSDRLTLVLAAKGARPIARPKAAPRAL